MTVRLFVSDRLDKGIKVALNEMQHHYVMHVMRSCVGDTVMLFNGVDGEWIAEISELSKKIALLSVLKQTRMQEKTENVWLCFAPVKKDNTDLIVQKATELGVGVLCPVITKRTITSKINYERMRLLAIEASEQSERLSIPTVMEAKTLNDLLNDWDEKRTLYYLSERQEAKKIEKFSSPAAFLVGPEGGFDADEIKKLSLFKFAMPVHLGKRILRAETACIASMVIWNQAIDWK